MIWLITKYHCDEMGKPYGDPYTSVCYTAELMETYKNPKYVVKITEKTEDDKYKVIWTNGEEE